MRTLAPKKPNAQTRKPYTHSGERPDWRHAGLTKVPAEWSMYRASCDALVKVLSCLPVTQRELGAMVELHDGVCLMQMQVSTILHGESYISEGLARRLAAACAALQQRYQRELVRAGQRVEPFHWWELVNLADRTNMVEAA